MDDKDCTVLYKILTPSEKESLPSKSWKGTALDVPKTLDLFFAKDSGVGDELYLCAVPRRNVKTEELKFEQGFPHIYGTIDPSSDISDTFTIQRKGETGKFALDDLQH